MTDQQRLSHAQGTLYVLSGPSGSGKTSLCAALLQCSPRLRLSVSATTRAPRPGEVDGVDYNFLDAESFEQAIAEGQFLEHAWVHGNAYGTRKSDVQATLAEGHDMLLEIDWQGAALVADACPQACRIFILPPSVDELCRRLTGRAQDADEVIERRVAAARSEMAHAGGAQYRKVHGDFDTAWCEIVEIC
ncbi:MAG: guanylate kinase, partial [Mariprofundaceae bacterium]|nr:guanylate kinase [Mariprofundaceae bacterium]